MNMKFGFGNIVLVDGNQVGVVVKMWEDNSYEVYVRSHNAVHHYEEKEVQHFVYNKEMSEEDMEYQN